MAMTFRLSRNLVEKLCIKPWQRVPVTKLHGSCWRVAKKMTEEFQPERPVKYTTSKAHDYSAFETFEPPKRDWPCYQPISLIISTSVFLLYFCVLREENDLDMEIAKPLYQRIPGLEETELRAAIDFEHKHGRDTSDLRKRLKDLQDAQKPAISP